jgi:flagellar biosynthesis/type III secretory pathway M-ring protein FliF/YscJ
VEFLIVLAVLAVVVFVVTGPLRRHNETAREAPVGDQVGELEDQVGELEDQVGELEDQVGELEAARDAKYREIRDAELDHRTGKLSDADFEAVDQALRAEAIEILHKLDRVRGPEEPGAQPPGG